MACTRLAALALAAGAATHAGAQGQDGHLRLSVDHTMTVDNNLFRLPASAADPHLASRGLSGKGDTLSVTNVGLGYEKSWSQQRLSLGVTQSRTSYDKFSFLDRESLNYRGELQWTLTPQVTGSVRMDRSASPLALEDTRDLERNQLINTNRVVSVVVAPGGPWQFHGNLFHTERKHERPVPTRSDFTADGYEAGARYITRFGSALGVSRRSQRGLNTGGAGAAGTITGGFSIDETDLTLAWPVTGRSSLNAKLSRYERKHDDNPERDFSGWAGDLGHTWTITGRLSMVSTYQRALSAFIRDVRSSYRQDDTFAIAPSWQAFERLRFGARVGYQRSEFLGPTGGVPAAGAAGERSDRLKTMSASVEWTPFQGATFRLSAGRDRRDSTDSLFGYRSGNVAVAVSLVW